VIGNFDFHRALGIVTSFDHAILERKIAFNEFVERCLQRALLFGLYLRDFQYACSLDVCAKYFSFCLNIIEKYGCVRLSPG
jgi:hypothetical protein